MTFLFVFLKSNLVFRDRELYLRASRPVLQAFVPATFPTLSAREDNVGGIYVIPKATQKQPPAAAGNAALLDAQTNIQSLTTTSPGSAQATENGRAQAAVWLSMVLAVPAHPYGLKRQDKPTNPNALLTKECQRLLSTILINEKNQPLSSTTLLNGCCQRLLSSSRVNDCSSTTRVKKIINVTIHDTT